MMTTPTTMAVRHPLPVLLFGLLSLGPRAASGLLAVGEWTPQCGQTSASVLTCAPHSRQGLRAMAMAAYQIVPLHIVHALAAWCRGRGCMHFRVLDVGGYPDEKLP